MLTPIPTDLSDIAALDDPVVRNLLITQRYHDLSATLRETIGTADANWSTFACWASKTAGESIRGEEVPRWLDELVGGSEVALERARAVEVHLRELVAHLTFGPAELSRGIAKIIRAVAAEIAAGNLAVYAELTPKFADFCARFRGVAAPSQREVDTFLATLTPGPVEAGGQDLLREAFSAYLRAKTGTDESLRAREMLLGNVLIGLHEQTRLQPRIRAALDAPVEVVVVDGVSELVRAALPGFLEETVVARLGPSLGALAAELGKVWERFATELLMQLALPGGKRLSLHRDLTPDYPAELANVESPHALVALLARFERQTEEVGDWAELPNRMGFIARLFRNYQQSAELFGQPFSASARASIELRELPPEDAGPL